MKSQSAFIAKHGETGQAPRRRQEKRPFPVSWRVSQRTLGAAGLLAAIAFIAQITGVLSEAALDRIALAAILVIGIPHGALDVALARKTGLLPNAKQGLAVLACYLGLIAGVIAAWFVAPLLTFSGFLIMSALHFGADRELAHLDNPFARAAVGALPICLPAFFHAEAYKVLIAPLVGEHAALATELAGLAGLGAFMIAGANLLQRKGAAREIAYLALLAGSAALLQPLVSFAIYFVLFHSAQHYREHWPDFLDRPALTAASGAICGSIFLLVLAALHFRAAIFEGAPTAALLFLLSAVSLPHAILVTYSRTSSALAGPAEVVR